ncbi:MAG: LytTR family transcriptional regulator DNA-binding domain-containing protein [Eubacteriales bacterium]|nr:LytTR family transcriptional regulator DNA-binding domain-containing protein [Eubacteriales bacterium]
MINILLLEDDSSQLIELENMIMLHSYNASFQILRAANYEDALFHISNNHIHIYILNAQPEAAKNSYSAFDIARIIRYEYNQAYAPIIFTSNDLSDISIAVNELHCCNYLLKPYSCEHLHKALDFCFSLPQYHINYFDFKDVNGIHIRINETDINYIEAAAHSVKLHTPSISYTSRSYSMDTLEHLLSSTFIRCHKKYIVSKKNITHYDKTNLLLTVKLILNNTSTTFNIPVGRHYKTSFETKFNS